MASTGTTGAGGILKLKVASGSLVALAQITNINAALGTDSVNVTPLGAGGIGQNIPGERFATVTADLNWLPATYAATAADLLNEWQVTTVSDYQITFTNPTTTATWDFRGFLTGLDITMPRNAAATGSLAIQCTQAAASQIIMTLGTGGTVGSGAALAATIGDGFVLRVSDVAETTEIEIAEITECRMSLTKTAVEITSLGSGFVKEFIPGERTGTMGFDVIWLPDAVADKASHGPATGSATQPSLFELWREREIADWLMVFEEEAAVGGNHQTWGFDGFITGLSPTLPQDDATVGTCDVQLTGDIAATTEAV